MTDQERLQRFIDLQEMITSRGYQWLRRKWDEEIKEEQEMFLRVDNDDLRLEKQIRLKMLNEIKVWADYEVKHCQDMGLGRKRK